MRLINQSGEQLDLDGSAWSELLHVAVLRGWTPSGTTTPPVDFDGRRGGEWGGNYDEASGQMVTREDAARLAQAVSEAALEPWTFQYLGEASLERAVTFLHSGPFLVTGEVQERAEAGLAFDHQLLSLDAVLRDAAGEWVQEPAEERAGEA